MEKEDEGGGSQMADETVLPPIPGASAFDAPHAQGGDEGEVERDQAAATTGHAQLAEEGGGAERKDDDDDDGKTLLPPLVPHPQRIASSLDPQISESGVDKLLNDEVASSSEAAAEAAEAADDAMMWTRGNDEGEVAQPSTSQIAAHAPEAGISVFGRAPSFRDMLTRTETLARVVSNTSLGSDPLSPRGGKVDISTLRKVAVTSDALSLSEAPSFTSSSAHAHAPDQRPYGEGVAMQGDNGGVGESVAQDEGRRVEKGVHFYMDAGEDEFVARKGKEKAQRMEKAQKAVAASSPGWTGSEGKGASGPVPPQGGMGKAGSPRKGLLKRAVKMTIEEQRHQRVSQGLAAAKREAEEQGGAKGDQRVQTSTSGVSAWSTHKSAASGGGQSGDDSSPATRSPTAATTTDMHKLHPAQKPGFFQKQGKSQSQSKKFSSTKQGFSSSTRTRGSARKMAEQSSTSLFRLDQGQDASSVSDHAASPFASPPRGMVPQKSFRGKPAPVRRSIKGQASKVVNVQRLTGASKPSGRSPTNAGSFANRRGGGAGQAEQSTLPETKVELEEEGDADADDLTSFFSAVADIPDTLVEGVLEAGVLDAGGLTAKDIAEAQAVAHAVTDAEEALIPQEIDRIVDQAIAEIVRTEMLAALVTAMVEDAMIAEVFSLAQDQVAEEAVGSAEAAELAQVVEALVSRIEATGKEQVDVGDGGEGVQVEGRVKGDVEEKREERGGGSEGKPAGKSLFDALSAFGRISGVDKVAGGSGPGHLFREAPRLLNPHGDNTEKGLDREGGSVGDSSSALQRSMARLKRSSAEGGKADASSNAAGAAHANPATAGHGRGKIGHRSVTVPRVAKARDDTTIRDGAFDEMMEGPDRGHHAAHEVDGRTRAMRPRSREASADDGGKEGKSKEQLEEELMDAMVAARAVPGFKPDKQGKTKDDKAGSVSKGGLGALSAMSKFRKAKNRSGAGKDAGGKGGEQAPWRQPAVPKQAIKKKQDSQVTEDEGSVGGVDAVDEGKVEEGQHNGKETLGKEGQVGESVVDRGAGHEGRKERNNLRRRGSEGDVMQKLPSAVGPWEGHARSEGNSPQPFGKKEGRGELKPIVMDRGAIERMRLARILRGGGQLDEDEEQEDRNLHDPEAWKVGKDPLEIQMQEAMWLKTFLEDEAMTEGLLVVQAHIRMKLARKEAVKEKRKRMFEDAMASATLNLAAAIRGMVRLKVSRMREAKRLEAQVEARMLELAPEAIEVSPEMRAKAGVLSRVPSSAPGDSSQQGGEARGGAGESGGKQAAGGLAAAANSIRSAGAGSSAVFAFLKRSNPDDPPPKELPKILSKPPKKKFHRKKNFFQREAKEGEPETDEHLFERLLKTARVYNKEHGIEYVGDLVPPISDERLKESREANAKTQEERLERQNSLRWGDSTDAADGRPPQPKNDGGDASPTKPRKGGGGESSVVGGVKSSWKKAENASVKTRNEIRHANASTTRMGLAMEMKEIWESLAAPDEFEEALLANRPAAEALMNKIQESMAVSLENPTLTPRSPKERPGDELKRLQMSPRKVALYRKNGLGDRFKDVKGHGQERSIYQVYDEELMRAAAAREREVVEKRLRDAAEEAQAKAEEMLTLVFNTVRKKEIKKLQQEAKDKLESPHQGRGVSLKPPPMM